MAELSEVEKRSLDDALSTLDDLYEATLQPDDHEGTTAGTIPAEDDPLPSRFAG
jgi:hypothetical protein